MLTLLSWLLDRSRWIEPVCFIAMAGDHSDLICVVAGKVSIDKNEKIGDSIRDW